MTSPPDADSDADLDADLGALVVVTEHLGAVVGTIEHSERTRATPCEGWDLGALVDHVTGGNWFTCQILAGQSAEVAMAATRARFDDTDIGEDRLIASLGAQFQAFHEDGALTRTCNHVVGDLTGRQVLRLRLHDLIVHLWDVQQTLRPARNSALPETLVGWGLAEIASNDSLTAQHFGLAASTNEDSKKSVEADYLRRFDRQF